MLCCNALFCCGCICILYKCVSHSKDEFLLQEDDPLVVQELERRVQRLEGRSEKGAASTGEKWKEQHATLAEQLGVQWPLSPSTALQESPWYKTLPPREQQAVNSF